jgi:ATP-dependent RNA helicase DOB1
VGVLSPGVWGAVINFERVGPKQGGDAGNGAAGYDVAGERRGGKKGRGKGKDAEGAAGSSSGGRWVVDVLVNGEQGWSGSTSDAMPDGRQRLRLERAGRSGSPHVVSFPLAHLDALSSVRVCIQKHLRPQEARQVGGLVCWLVRVGR